MSTYFIIISVTGYLVLCTHFLNLYFKGSFTIRQRLFNLLAALLCLTVAAILLIGLLLYDSEKLPEPKAK